MTGDLLREGLAAALAIGSKGSRARALAALAPQLTGEARDLALRERLAAAQAIGDEGSRVRAMAALAPQLTGEARDLALREGLAAAQAIGSGRNRAHAMAALAPQLTGEVRDLALREGLAAAQAIGDEEYRAHALAALAPHFGDQTACLCAIQRAVADHLRNNLASRRRVDLLIFMADFSIFTPPILSSTILAAIASHIIETCNDWTWL